MGFDIIKNTKNNRTSSDLMDKIIHITCDVNK